MLLVYICLHHTHTIFRNWRILFCRLFVFSVSISGEQGDEALHALKEIASHTPERSSFDYIGLETRVKKLESVINLSAAGKEKIYLENVNEIRLIIINAISFAISSFDLMRVRSI